MLRIGSILIALFIILTASCSDDPVSDVTCETAGWICLGGSDIGGGGGGTEFITIKPTISLTAGVENIFVDWAAIDGATRYLVFYSTSSSGPFTELSITAPSTDTSLAGLTGDQTYYVYMQAANDSGLRTLASDTLSATPTAAE